MWFHFTSSFLKNISLVVTFLLVKDGAMINKEYKYPVTMKLSWIIQDFMGCVRDMTCKVYLAAVPRAGVHLRSNRNKCNSFNLKLT